MRDNHSLIDAAVDFLLVEKKPYDLYQLFDLLTKDAELSEEVAGEMVTKFYTDLTTSAKFVYTGDNQWDLKANQKIELWEKDGSFYKEYSKVDLPDEYKETPKPKKPVAEPVVVVEEKPEPVVEVKVEEQVELVEPVVEQPITPENVETPEDDSVENYEEEIFDDYDDFDEDKYNEYMDTYEDQYDD